MKPRLLDLISRLNEAADDINNAHPPRHSTYLLLSQAAVALADSPEPCGHRQSVYAIDTLPRNVSGDEHYLAVDWALTEAKRLILEGCSCPVATPEVTP